MLAEKVVDGDGRRKWHDEIKMRIQYLHCWAGVDLKCEVFNLFSGFIPQQGLNRMVLPEPQAEALSLRRWGERLGESASGRAPQRERLRESASGRAPQGERLGERLGKSASGRAPRGRAAR